MRLRMLIVILLMTTFALLNAVYNVGDVVDDYSWTDNTGEAHSIYELTAQGIVPVLFWGGTG